MLEELACGRHLEGNAEHGWFPDMGTNETISKMFHGYPNATDLLLVFRIFVHE